MSHFAKEQACPAQLELRVFPSDIRVQTMHPTPLENRKRFPGPRPAGLPTLLEPVVDGRIYTRVLWLIPSVKPVLTKGTTMITLSRSLNRTGEACRFRSGLAMESLEASRLLAADLELSAINEQLAQSGMDVAVAEVNYFTVGEARPSDRIHQQPFRWVPEDSRRLATGDDLTYLVETSTGATTSGLSAIETENAIDRAMDTWRHEPCLKKLDVIKKPDLDVGVDWTIFDSFFGFGEGPEVPKFPFQADIVNAGWYPKEYFDAVAGPGGGEGILAFSVTFWFVDENGVPTDIDGDNYVDTALNEVYFNDHFGTPGGGRELNPWGTDVALPGIDVETVALHENGHSLGLGHFGPPPAAVMNPVYAGTNHTPDAADHAGMCAVYGSWGARPSRFAALQPIAENVGATAADVPHDLLNQTDTHETTLDQGGNDESHPSATTTDELPVPGDADLDRRFDARDIEQVLQSAKYLTSEEASWSEGDWDGNGVFNQLDIVLALQTGQFLAV